MVGLIQPKDSLIAINYRIGSVSRPRADNGEVKIVSRYDDIPSDCTFSGLANKYGLSALLSGEIAVVAAVDDQRNRSGNRSEYTDQLSLFPMSEMHGIIYTSFSRL